MFLLCFIIFFRMRIPNPSNQVSSRDKVSVLHLAYSWKCIKFPKNTDESGAASKQSYPNTKWVEFRVVLISTGPQATTAHSPLVYNQRIQFSRPKLLQQRKAESHFPRLIRHVNSQFKEKEVLFLGLEDVHQLENIGMLHPGETRHKAQGTERDVRSLGNDVWIIHWDWHVLLPVSIKKADIFSYVQLCLCPWTCL